MQTVIKEIWTDWELSLGTQESRVRIDVAIDYMNWIDWIEDKVVDWANINNKFIVKAAVISDSRL